MFSFYIGKNSEQSKIMIGFRLSTYASGSIAVGPIDDLCHIPENMKIAIKVNFNCQFFLDMIEIKIGSKVYMVYFRY